jgi:putative spermidine/putrescine transport system substrate-binding protein
MNKHIRLRFVVVSVILLLVATQCAAPAQTTPENGVAPTGAVPETGAIPAECQNFTMVSYGGATGEPHRFFLADPFEQHWGVNVELVPTSSSDVLVQVQAATGRPPYDTIPLDVGPQITWSQEGILEETPSIEQVPNLADVYEEYMADTHGHGVPATYSIIGIAYNPELIDPPPTSWEDLWKPEYRGLVGIPTPVSSLGRGFVWVAGMLNGGDETSIDPAFQKLAELRPNIAVIAPNPPAVATMFERGEIAIAPLWNNNTAILKNRGLSIEWIAPEEGAVVVQSNMNIISGAPCEEMLHDYLNRVLSVEYQTQAAAAPYFFGPTNRNVQVPEEARAFMPTTPEEVASLIHIDWETWDLNRETIIDRFNREVGTATE